MPDDPLTIPVEGQGVDTMAKATPQFASLHDQNMAGMGAATTRFLNDAATVSKAADYQYLQDKNMVSLPESLGAREIASEKNPGGPSKP